MKFILLFVFIAFFATSQAMRITQKRLGMDPNLVSINKIKLKEFS